MPFYTFICEDCGEFDISQKMSDYCGKGTCPNCTKVSEERVLDLPYVAVKVNYSDIKEFKHVADRNMSNTTETERLEKDFAQQKETYGCIRYKEPFKSDKQIKKEANEKFINTLNKKIYGE